MPIISKFNDMTIKMYFHQLEQNPPYFHVISGEDTSSIDIRTLEILEGAIPKKKLTLVVDWARHYQPTLLEIWNTQKFQALSPISSNKEGGIQ